MNHAPDDSRPADPPTHDVGWFLRRELLTLPLAAGVVYLLILFGITPATLLFVALFVIFTLGWLWGGKT